MPLDCFRSIWAFRGLLTCNAIFSRKKEIVQFGGKRFCQEPSYAVMPRGNLLEFQARPTRKEKGPVKTGFALFHIRQNLLQQETLISACTSRAATVSSLAYSPEQSRTGRWGISFYHSQLNKHQERRQADQNYPKWSLSEILSLPETKVSFTSFSF